MRVESGTVKGGTVPLSHILDHLYRLGGEMVIRWKAWRGRVRARVWLRVESGTVL